MSSDGIDRTTLLDAFRRVETAWSGQRWDEWEATNADEYTFDPHVGPVLDVPATLRWSRGVFRAFPDYRQDVVSLITAQHTVVGIVYATGTHTGVFDVGLGFERAPTGRAFSLPYVKLLEFDDDLRVTRDVQFLDLHELWRQLGRDPEMEEAG